MIPDKILHVFPVPRWEKRLGRLYLASAAPGIVEISPTPPVSAADAPSVKTFDLENGLAIRSASVEWAGQERLAVTVYWESMERVEEGIPAVVTQLSADGFADAAEAIMTTDTRPKVISERVSIGGDEITVLGMAKGAGMIRPQLATMLAFIMTDASI